MNNKRSYSLDAAKLWMACSVALWHSGLELYPDADVIVDIFFLISGFFLARKFEAKQDFPYSALDYTVDHIRPMYPHFLAATVVIFLYTTVREMIALQGTSLAEQLLYLGETLYDQIPNFLFLQSTFSFHDTVNYPVWQISAMLISGYFVFGLLRWNTETARTMLFPAALLAYLSLLESQLTHTFDNWGPIYMPLLRGFACQGLGVLTWILYQKHPAMLNAKILNWFTPLMLLCLVIFNNQGFIYLLLVPMLILDFYTNTSWLPQMLNRNCFRNCGQLSLVIYLNHAVIARFVNSVIATRIPMSLGIKSVLFLIILLIYCYAAMRIVQFLTNRHKNAAST